GRHDEARPLLERAVESLRRGGPGVRLDLAEALRSLSVQDRRSGNLEAAADRLEEATALVEASFPAEHPRVALLRMTRGNLAKKLGDPVRAVEHYAAALGAYRKIYGSDHPRLAPV